MLKKTILLSLLLFSVFSTFSYSQSVDEVQPLTLQLDDKIPVDPDVMIGEFQNGLKYYIRENKKPENRAALWLAVNAGAVLEDDDQLGLAHFVEHMGFNGTKNFKKHELIDFLESIGMKFGPEINAFTSFDETVYFINVPTDSSYYLETGVNILYEWAQNVSFDDEEIDKERGVVGEEWRLGRGAQMRMFDQQLPILFHNSRYADRLTIGKKEIIDTCSYETLKRYYKDWYRPDLMAVVAVGDFNKDEIYNLIEQKFSQIPKPENPRKREAFPVPDHDEMLFALASDKEATRTQISIYFKGAQQAKENISDYKRDIITELYTQMLNKRFNELTKSAEPPFLYGYAGIGQFVRTKGVYYLGAAVKDNGIDLGLTTLLTEANKVKKFGFTNSEFERAKIQMLRGIEKSFKEKDKTESNRFARSYVNNFLNNNPILSFEQSLALSKQLLPEIKLEEINELANNWITEKNRVVLISSPENDSVSLPTNEHLISVFKDAENKELLAYEDRVNNDPLIALLPVSGEIINETRDEDIGIIKLKLANGINIILKKTDFKNDEIIFNSYSFGGNSLVPDDSIVSAMAASQIIKEAGVGTFSNIELGKKLTGKVVNVNPYVSELYEGISGSASPEDLETMFKLIYLYLTSPRTDIESFQSYLSKMQAYVKNRNARPETAFYDTIRATLSQNHIRARAWDTKLLDEINFNSAMNIYKDRFKDFGDFTFFFVGNYELDTMKTLIQTYLGSLPNINRIESWKDVKINYPKGIIKKKVSRGIEEKSQVQLVFTGDYSIEYENNYAINSLTDVLRIKLREVLREDLGGTYGVSIGSNTKIYPTPKYSMSISFGCNPDRVDELLNSLFAQIDSVKMFGTTQVNIDKVKEIQSRNYELNLKKNSFWLNELYWKHFYNEDLLEILKYPDYVNSLTNDIIIDAANKYFNLENYVQVILYPEEESNQE